MVNGSAWWRSLCSLGLLVGCATAAPPPADNAVLSPPPEEMPAPPAAPPRPRRSGEATSITRPEDLVGLCQALREEPAAENSGDPVQQAKAAAAHAERRQAAQAASYVTVIPSSGFSFRSYQMGEHRLVLATDRSFVLGDGAELFASSRDVAPGFSLSPDFAERLLGERAAGQLGLRLIFRPAHSELRRDACMWLSGGRVVKLEIDIVAVALLGSDGSVIARGDTGEYGDPTGGVPVRSPKVTVKKPRDPSGRDVSETMVGAFAPLASAASSCYERVLHVRPALRGTVVLAIRVGPGGKLEEPRVEMSSLGDDAVTACVAGAVGKATVSGLGPGQRFSVPLQFGSADDL